MAVKTILASGAALICAWGGALLAQGTAPGAPVADPPLLAADASAAARQAWIDRYIVPGQFVEVDADADRVYLYDPASVTKTPDGNVTGRLRAELFRPRTVGGVTVRSVVKRAAIDCAGLRYKELGIEGYAGANLQRPVEGLPLGKDWTPPATAGSLAGRTLFPACLDTAGFARTRQGLFTAFKQKNPPQDAAIADIKARTAAMVAAAGPTLAPVDRPAMIWSTSPTPLIVFDVPVGPRMVVVPAGEFTMGSPASEADEAPDERLVPHARGRRLCQAGRPRLVQSRLPAGRPQPRRLRRL